VTQVAVNILSTSLDALDLSSPGLLCNTSPMHLHFMLHPIPLCDT
jgi:hypothetical protein